MCEMHSQRLKKYKNPLIDHSRREERERLSYVEGDVGYIALTRGLFAKVDRDDFEPLMKHLWCANRNPQGTWCYAVRAVRLDGKRDYALGMHNAIMKPSKGQLVDHINGNGLDNRRCNLRVCSPMQNAWNRRGKSPSRGFFFDKKRKRYRASIMVAGKSYSLGSYKCPEDAALAYNKKAIELHGAFASLNVIPRGESAEGTKCRNSK